MNSMASKRIRSYSRVLVRDSRMFFMLLYAMLALGTLISALYVAAIRPSLSSEAEYSSIAADMVLAAYAAGGIFIIVPLFRELYDIRFVDLDFSLPLSSSERFFAKLWLLVKHHLLPMLAAEGVLAVQAFVKLGGPESSDELVTVIYRLTSAMGMLVFLDCTAILCVTLCGRLGECIAAVPLTAAVLSLFPTYLFAAFSDNTFSIRNLRFVPFGVMDYFSNPSGSFRLTVPGAAARAVINIALSLLLLLAAARIYKTRSGAETGAAVISDKLYYLSLFGISIATITVMPNEQGFILPVLLVGCAGCILLTAAVNRKRQIPFSIPIAGAVHIAGVMILGLLDIIR
ncbi:MAG: hypothetical protein IKP47_10635 [Ruminococcus sp.]|nr:hypothetical protein [Ruminococcus sp.]